MAGFSPAAAAAAEALGRRKIVRVCFSLSRLGRREEEEEEEEAKKTKQRAKEERNKKANEKEKEEELEGKSCGGTNARTAADN